jgi:3-oxoacyl-[acyl-carrier protein] reductase
MTSGEQFANLSSLRAVVTGASTGIGRAIALELARGGARTIVHCRRSLEAARAVCAEIQSTGGEAHVLSADVGRPNSARELIEAAWNHWNGIDIWINNAGVDLLTGEGASLDYAEKLQRLLDVDVRGTVLISKEVGLRMREAGAGVILNIGWDQADRGMAGDSGELFSAAKNAVMGFTRSLAVGLAPEVRVNCIAPGWIKTAWGEHASDTWQERVLEETPLRRWGRPEDIAKLARFLVSPDADFITGQVVAANGGAVR